jgi:hypothetical protein
MDRSWSTKNFRGHSVKKPVNPRVSLIAAVDNYGKKYISILQANSNQNTTMLLLWQLIDILYAEDPDFNKKSILILDNAKYHRVDSVQAILHLRKVRYGYTSAYSP